MRTPMPDRPIPVLTPIEARVLGVLIEKQLTVPDSYPLSLNALVTGCNQKTSREPVMSITDEQAQEAIDGLRRLSLVIESSGSRTMRYAHNTRRVLGVPNESVALLATLMLRGPQTAAELRANAERLQRFSDGSALEAFLDELAAWPAGALVLRLPRQPGAREGRWVHLLCGTPEAGGASGQPSAWTTAHADDEPGRSGSQTRATDVDPETGQTAELHERIARLEARVRALDATVARLCAELGVAAEPGPNEPGPAESERNESERNESEPNEPDRNEP